MELLEKRVKSRFSHRQVTLFSDFTFEEYIKLFETMLSLPATFENKDYHKRWNDKLKVLIHVLTRLLCKFKFCEQMFTT